MSLVSAPGRSREDSRYFERAPGRGPERGATMNSQSHVRVARGTAWTVGLFYLLIAFEFFYMASPFAFYFYSAYLPGLELLERTPWLAWLTRFYLPHFSDTSSILLNTLPIVGGVVTAIGTVGFLVGAGQVYSRKLLRRGAATGGMYRFVRHPQYASLILAGAGMLLLWPRILMVVFFVMMLFAYRLLAWVEERECIRKYGQSYVDYQQRTPRFLPFRLRLKPATAAPLDSWPLRATKTLLAYAAASSLTFGLAWAMQGYSVRHLYSYSTDDTVHVALTGRQRDALARIAARTAADPRVLERLGSATEMGSRFIAYVMPWEWVIPEVPMSGAEAHRAPAKFDPRRFRVVYTRAVLSGTRTVKGLDILRYALRVEPVAEVWIDEEGRVSRVIGPPDKTLYRTVPVPVF